MKWRSRRKGFSLIEAIIFTALLSFLLTGFIRFASISFAEAAKLMDRIDEAWNAQDGFMATASVLILAMGLMAFSGVAMLSSSIYSDSVDRHGLRIQARLGTESCLNTLEIMYEKDIYLEGEIEVPDLNCRAKVINHKNGSIQMKVEVSLYGVIWRAERGYTGKYPLWL